MRKLDGMRSYIVEYTVHDDPDEVVYRAQFWADDEAHAGEQAEDSFPDLNCVVLIETQEAFEARTGIKVDY